MPTFKVSASEQQSSLYLDADGRATVVYTARNGSDDTVAGFAEIRPEDGAGNEWFQVVDSRHRVFRNREALQFKVEVAVPPSTSAGTFGLRLVVAKEDDSERDFAESESVKLHWNPHAIKRVNRVLVALLVLSAIACAIAIAAVAYLVVNREVGPEELLKNADAAVSAGKWGDYWDCWTDEGRDELLAQVAGLLAERLRTESRSEGLEAWIRGYGVAPTDLQEVRGPALVGDSRILETARTLKQRIQTIGRSEKEFFAGAAGWLEGNGDSAADAARISEFRNSFRYEISRPLPLDDSLAQDIVVWEGRRSAIDSAQARAGETLRVVFHKTNRSWLLYDVYPETLTRRTVWKRLPGRSTATPGTISGLETTNRAVASKNEPQYEAEVLILLDGPDMNSGPSGASKRQAISGTLDLSQGRLSADIAGKRDELKIEILPPFLILNGNTPQRQVFIDAAAGLTVGTFLYRKWSEVAPILEHDPFDRKIVVRKIGESKPVGDYYLNSMSLATPPIVLKASYVLPLPADPAQPVLQPSQTLQAAGWNLSEIASAASEEKLNDRAELRLLEPGNEAAAKPGSAAEKMLIIELVEKDPLAVRNDPIMNGLERDLQVKIKIALQGGGALDSASPPLVGGGAVPSQATTAEAVIRRSMERHGFDYFIDYAYKPDGSWFDWGWVATGGRKRLRITLNRFGYELQPTEKTDLWGASSLAFRKETDGMRMAVGDQLGGIMLDSRLSLNVPQNTWQWDGAKEQLAALKSKLSVSLKEASLPEGAGNFNLALHRGPLDWSGTSTVMPFDKFRFALDDGRSATDRAFGSVAISTDGRWLAGGDSQGRLRIWRQRDGGEWNLAQESRLGDFLRAFFPQIQLQMRGIAFSADASRIAVAVTVMFQKKDDDRELPRSGYVLVLRRDAEALPYSLLPRLEVAGTSPLCVAFHRSAASEYLAAGRADGKVDVWKWNGTAYLKDDRSPQIDNGSAVLSIVFGSVEAGQGDWLATGHADGRVHLTDRNREPWSAVVGFRASSGSNRQAVQSLAFSPHGAVLAGTTYEGVRLWQLRDLEVERESAP